jgi:hypothetical protein
MFGFHSQALRSNMNARRLTDCTYLAQSQMERLLSMDWTSVARPADLTDGGGADPFTAGMWDDLEWPGTTPVPPVSATFSTTPTTVSPAMYTVTWDVEDMDANATWARLRVRCTYQDAAFGSKQGTTISSYRYRDS